VLDAQHLGVVSSISDEVPSVRVAKTGRERDCRPVAVGCDQPEVDGGRRLQLDFERLAHDVREPPRVGVAPQAEHLARQSVESLTPKSLAGRVLHLASHEAEETVIQRSHAEHHPVDRSADGEQPP
jgi:hypothetical protein